MRAGLLYKKLLNLTSRFLTPACSCDGLQGPPSRACRRTDLLGTGTAIAEVVAGADEDAATWQSESRSGAGRGCSIESLRGALRSTGGGDGSCERTMLAAPPPVVRLARAPAARALRSERHPGGCLALGEDVCCAQSEGFPSHPTRQRFK